MNFKQNVEIHMKWWLKYLYLPGLCIFYKTYLTFNPEADINLDKVASTMVKGLKIKVVCKHDEY